MGSASSSFSQNVMVWYDKTGIKTESTKHLPNIVLHWCQNLNLPKNHCVFDSRLLCCSFLSSDSVSLICELLWLFHEEEEFFNNLPMGPFKVLYCKQWPIFLTEMIFQETWYIQYTVCMWVLLYLERVNFVGSKQE